MKGLNNHDVMQSALCTFIYASPSPGRLGTATALLDRQLEEAGKCQDFFGKVLAS